MSRKAKAGEPRCPVCRGALPSVQESPERGPEFAPMCSMRCKRIDLATWLGEGYRIAGEPAESMPDEETERHTGDEG